LNKNNVYWLFQVVGWLSYTIVQIFLLSFDDQHIDKMLIIGEGLQMAVNILLTHLFRYVIIHFKWLNFRLLKLIPLVFLSVLLLCGVGSVFLGIIVRALIGSVPLEMVMEAMVAHVIESLFVYSFWAFAYFIYLYFERYNNSLKYEATLRETELNNLKAQLNPHFIFNALNSIRALVDENPGKSKEAITQLSHILRNSLNSDRQKLVPFVDELRTVQDYLGLESIRYEERLRTRIELDKGSELFQIPPLMIQTLVENGIKHGIAKLTKGGEISIITKVKEKGLIVEIRNTGQLLDKKRIKPGFGIHNTRRRLEMIYGKDAEFRITNENETTVLTKIRIPR
jgi:two-component system LytT family sensor kinase